MRERETAMRDLLEEIVARKVERLKAAKRKKPLVELQAEAAACPNARPSLLQACARPDRLNIIAEVKRASPSRGVLREDFDPIALAREYERNGAAAISVLTEEDHFQGALEHLRMIRHAVSVPLLRKDFLFDPYQVYEAAAAGADAVLLIAALLDATQLRDLLQLAEDLGLDALVEVHNLAEFEEALAAGARLIGVNNRNLRTFAVDCTVSFELAKHAPRDVVLVSESGLSTHQELEALRRVGYRAFLIGEHLMRAAHPGKALRALLGGSDRAAG
ncbi:MAG: indole-3-glycerol phosphate synthase TrpC [Blastocatellia bacterium]|nr:indole-3-glycerol phosphate synthase TrpC [Blastocatellia bacterium]MCS7158232.1 indole-3-glycerol phosphate synthase TrpC [Blastocatellia bacterium]MCX7753070.1 indole-3-glycerol phosphate synthase TrpC [Blastocatellia bacterium]MDW8169386.1 indole-3-glycerol phosphate synthase TrpC [Acidobacteriota bacterium]MDW8256453.1 indole-3-glycerol phosphate synthase TrpC [Acidobacteriota bacterium]